MWLLQPIAENTAEASTSGICFANFTVRVAFVSTTTIIPSPRLRLGRWTLTRPRPVHSFIKSFQVGGADDIYRRYLRKDGGRGGGRKKKTRREKERKREKKQKDDGNDVSVRGQLPRLLIKSADGQGGEGDRGT